MATPQDLQAATGGVDLTITQLIDRITQLEAQLASATTLDTAVDQAVSELNAATARGQAALV